MKYARCIQDNMVLNLIDHIKSRKEFYNSIPALKLLVTSLEERHKKIWNLSGSIGMGKKIHHREIKIGNRKKLCTAAHAVASGLLTFARMTHNKSLQHAVNYSYSDFYRSLEQDMLSRCKQVLRTVQRIKDLSHIGYNAVLTQNLIDRIAKYEGAMERKNDHKATLKKNHRTLNRLLNESMAMIHDKLNPLMTMLAEIHPEEAHGYFLRVKLKKIPGRRKRYKRKPKQAVAPVTPQPVEIIPVVKIFEPVLVTNPG